MISRALTPRRRQVLETLRALAGTPATPVHYSAVAERLGLSTWTAYGMLKELEALGLATRSYATRQAGGRSRILFLPASQLAASGAGTPAALRAAFDRFAAIADDTAAVAAYVTEAGTDIAWHLGFWLGRIDTAGRQVQAAARSVLEGGGLPASKAQAIAALGLGSALTRIDRDRLAARLTAASARFTLLLEEAARASDTHLAALIEGARRLEVSS
ncbi:MAG TPA: hypothetical protein VF134_09020 [Candidatus Dormibacteraeota bacterium]